MSQASPPNVQIPHNLMPQEFDPSIPPPEEMLERLHAVDLTYFDSEKIFVEMKGKQVWISAMTIPVTVVILAIFTLIGTFVFDSPILSFAIGAGLMFWAAKFVDANDQNLRFAAHQEVIRRIAETEGEFGLIPHFKHFLPERYRHLWQSLRRGNYQYIEQYLQAVHLLQRKLEAEKFTKVWELKYPQFVKSETPLDETLPDSSKSTTQTPT